MPQSKMDLYKEHKAEYAATRKPALVTAGKAKYLVIEGQGAPGSEMFCAGIGAMYGVAFTVKMTRKFAGRQDYAVSKLEALWWSDGEENFANAPKDAWRWKLMIRTPDFITQKDVAAAVAALTKRGKGEGADRVHLESVTEGKCAQMLHVGPYDREAETIDAMKAFAAALGLSFHGRHHEIYLSDPRRVVPEKLKTILRVPVAAK